MQIPTQRFKITLPNVLSHNKKKRTENQEITILLGKCLKFRRVYIILNIPAQDLNDTSREAEQTLM
jgi:hypothetical protein